MLNHSYEYPNGIVFYVKSRLSEELHAVSLLSFFFHLSTWRNLTIARTLVFHPILKCFQSLEFSAPNKSQFSNVSFIISRELLFPVFFHIVVVLTAPILSQMALLFPFLFRSLLSSSLDRISLPNVFIRGAHKPSSSPYRNLLIILVDQNRFQCVFTMHTYQLCIPIAPFPSSVVSLIRYVQL